MTEPIQIRLDDGAPPYLVGKVLNLPQSADADRLRLIAIPRWAVRGSTLAPCNDVSECDVMPPVEPGAVAVEEGWIEEPDGSRTIIRVLSAYVRR